MNEKKINQFVEDLKFHTLGGFTLEKAYEKFRKNEIENYESKFLLELDEAKNILNTKSVKSLNFSIVSSKKQEDWYFGPQEFHQNWHAYKNYLLKVKNRSKDVIDLLDEESSSVVNQLLNPKYKGDKRIQGLVLGYVQSGKTANMAGVIAKAADTGYKLIIVLAGLTDALREQTQDRIQNDILNHNEMIWHPLTDKESDISASTDKIPISSEKTTLCVIKKRVQIVERLITKMNKLPKPDLNAPTLIIDDECDQASLNTKEYKNDADDISKTNALLKKLLNDFKNVTYVGYTATPNAPFLTNPTSPNGLQSLFPSDFIKALEEPKDYFGINKLFGIDGIGDNDISLPFINRIFKKELDDLQCPRKSIPLFEPSLTQSLKNACDYYLLALAARKIRGLGDDHCCMMIHVSRSKVIHDRFRKLIKKEWLDPIKDDLRKNDIELISRLRKIWDKESKSMKPSLRNNLNCPKEIESFDELKKYLLSEIENISIIVENSDEINANTRLKFKDKKEEDFKTVHAIVIGGDVLSRGLTIEGLVSSFFLRDSKQDDTLMQMGRWFGYRNGYEDLPRIWMTNDVELDFAKFVDSENYYRSQITFMNSQNRKPSDYPPIVRKFENRNPTSKGKISKSVKSSNGTFYGREIWTLRFALDQEIHQNNKKIIDELVVNSQSSKNQFQNNGEKNYVIKDVDFKPVLKFLRDFIFYEKEIFNSVIGFIESDLDKDERSYFKNWNISIKGGDGENDTEVGNLPSVKTCQRTKIQNGSIAEDRKIINLKSLMGSDDLYVDVDADEVKKWKKSEAYKSYKKQKRAASRKCRENIYGYRPLLIIYPISKDSMPQSNNRFKLFEKTISEGPELDYKPHDLFGIVVAFPNPPGKIFNTKDLVLDI
ncbi:MAG: Z1 domain-containing protein [Prochlorococcus marinus XMU1425]|nr:Z1 domain-containing protein [Prochlorococcus marinus XMU1425]MCR8533204.1 Z1 domain-containing protein [Prochlorococcus marinus XMU1426]